MNSTGIKSLKARAGIDCKGKPILEVDIYTESGVLGRASSPSGISAGEHEAFVLRDHDPLWHDGNGVFKAVEMAEKVVFPAIQGMDVMDCANWTERPIKPGWGAMLLTVFPWRHSGPRRRSGAFRFTNI
jgi:enolase